MKKFLLLLVLLILAVFVFAGDDDDTNNKTDSTLPVDLCFSTSEKIKVWSNYKTDSEMNFTLGKLDCLFINTREWHTPLHYNVLPKQGEFHLGLLSIATIFKNKGYQAKVIDFGVIPKINFSDIENIIKKTKPKLIGLIARSSNIRTFLDLAEFIKKVDKNIQITLGGIEVTNSTEKFLYENEQIDLICNNESEETIVDILMNLPNNVTIANVPGISYRNIEMVVKNCCRKDIKNLDSIPFPDYSLIILPDSKEKKKFQKAQYL